MAVLSFMLQLMAAVMFLLFAIHMIRTGIERRFGASFKRQLTKRDSLPGAAVSGAALAMILQSSAAVVVLVATFAADRFIGFAMGLTIALGADLGSALLIQVLSVELTWLVPTLLASGGWMFIKVREKGWREPGRILLGVAFILISLQYLKDAVGPIRESTFLPAIVSYLQNDFLTSFIVGAVLAFVMHSSVATILMCTALVQIGSVPFDAAVSILLGANTGSGFIPVWLTKGLPSEARRVPFANAILRGAYAFVILLAFNVFWSSELLLIADPAQSLILTHIMFNFTLLLLALPICRQLETPMSRLLPSHHQPHDAAAGLASVAMETPVEIPAQAIAMLKRELLHMNEQVERMFRLVPDVLKDGDQDLIDEMQRLDQDLANMQSGIRSFVTSNVTISDTKHDRRIIKDLLDYAVRLKAAGDVMFAKVGKLGSEKSKNNLRYSNDGWDEFMVMCAAIDSNRKLASNVLVSDDLASARKLVTEKASLKKIERRSRRHHFKRIQDGRVDSLDTSDLHLETLRALRDLNNHICAVAYPILHRSGQLLNTKLRPEPVTEEAK